jgi:hypothetical protein
MVEAQGFCDGRGLFQGNVSPAETGICGQILIEPHNITLHENRVLEPPKHVGPGGPWPHVRVLPCRLCYAAPHSDYSGRKITASLRNVTVRGEEDGKGKRGARLSTVCLSMYSMPENIYCSQLSSVAILMQPEPVFTSYSTRKGLGSLSSCTISLRSSPHSHVSTCDNEVRRYFASTACLEYNLKGF